MPIESPRPERPSQTPPERTERLAGLQAVEIAKLQDALRSAPHAAVLVLPGKEKDTMMNEWKALTAEHAMLATLAETAAASPDAANLRALTVALASYEEHSLAFDIERDVLVLSTATRIASELGLPATEIEPLAKALEYAVSKPAADAPRELSAEFKTVSAGRMDALRSLTIVVGAISKNQTLPDDVRKTVSDSWTAYRGTKETYDAHAEAFGAKKLADLVGIDGSVESVRRFIAEVTAPLPPLSQAPAFVQSDPRMAELAAQLASQQTEMKTLLPSLVRSGCDPRFGDTWTWNISEYLVNRSAYETRVLGTENLTDYWSMYGTVVAQELLEEGAEAIPRLQINGRLSFLRGLEGPVRLSVLKGMRDLQNQGFSGKMLSQVLDTFRKSPLGPKFWNEIFKVESAATVLLWGLFVYNSPNKLQASIQFGSFIALSNAVSKVSGPVVEALTALNVAQKFKVPGVNFALQFGIAMAAAFVAGDKIVAFSKWVDESIPDSALKHKSTVALSIVSGEPIMSGIADLSDITGATGLLDKAGLTGFDPDRDLMSYLGTESIRGGDWGGGSELELDYRFSRTTDDWNARLQQAIGAQDNEIQKKLWDTLHVDAGDWASRQALQLFSSASAARQVERSLEQTLRTAGVLKEGEAIRGCEIATMDEPAEKKNVALLERVQVRIGDDLRNRNDRITDRAFDWDPVLVKAGKYFNALPKTDPKYGEWKDYVRTCKGMAKNVSIYRHNNMYARGAWLGDVSKLGEGTGLANMPETVRRGLMAEVRHQIGRRNLLTPEAFPELTRPAFREKLVGTVKFKEKLGFLETGFMLFTNSAGVHAADRAARDGYFELLFAVQDAQKSLPDDKIETVLQPMRELILAGKVASADQIRSARASLDRAILEQETKRVPLKEAPAVVRADIGAKDGAPVLLQGDPAAAVYRFSMKQGAKEQEFHPFNSLPKSTEHQDLFVARVRDDGGFFRLYENNAFSCPSADRATWKVSITEGRLTTGTFSRTEGVSYYHPYSWKLGEYKREVSFADWQKQHMETALQLEPEFRKLQTAKREQEAKLAAERELKALGEKMLRSESMIYALAMSGDLLPPEQLSRTALTGEAAERQARLSGEWKELEKDGLFKIFEAWGRANMTLPQARLMLELAPRGRQPALSIEAIHAGVVEVRGQTNFRDHMRFLDRALSYGGLYREQREFLRKNPPKSEKPAR